MTCPVYPDLNFRVNHPRGRVVWDWEGDEYTKHFYPPNLRHCEFTPFSLTGEMDYAGVDLALLHTNPMLGRDSALLAAYVERFPQRLRAMAPVDEWRIRTEPDAVITQVETAINTHRLHAIKFNSTHYMTGDTPWDDGPFRPFWQAATALGVPIFFTLGTGPAAWHGSPSETEQRQGYLKELAILNRWMERYPDTLCSITHGFPYRLYFEDNRLNLPKALWAPFANPNLSLEICFPVRLGDLFDYPYQELWPTLEAMVQRIGAHRLLWGTDMPFQNRFCTYTQSRTWIENYCTFLSPSDRVQIMGATAARILGL